LSSQVFGAFLEQINYQGKLTNNQGVPVEDGGKCMKFRLMDDLVGGNEVWSEVWTTSTEMVTTTRGLFSVMLGKHNSLSNVNFNQPLYLEVQFDPDCDGTFEEVFSPRKILGAVTASFEAKKLLGYDWASPGIIGATTPNEAYFTKLTVSATSTLSTTTIFGSLVVNDNLLYIDPTINRVGIGTSTLNFKLTVDGDFYVSATSSFMGKVGIGTIAPVSLLELYKTDSSPILTITSATSTTYSPQIQFRTGTTPTTNFTLGVDISTGKLKIIPSSDISTSTGITIDSSGNVGIGTTTPAYQLDIVGNMRATNYVRSETGFCIGENCISSWGSAVNYWTLDGSYLYPNNLTWNVGIGTSTPPEKLTVDGNILASGNLTIQGLTSLATTTISTQLSVPLITTQSGQLLISPYQNATTTITGSVILASQGGNVGIGTATPATTLQIVGTTTARTILPEVDNLYNLGDINLRWANIYAVTTTIGGTIIIGSNTIQGTATTTLFTANNLNQLVLGANGNIGIGTTAPDYKLDVAGPMRLIPSSEPTGANGVIYYDSTLNKFRCYENGAWKDCITTAVNNVRVDVFTSNGTWFKPAGAKFVKVIVTGGGGGGGTATCSDNTCESAGSGGGAGATTIKIFSAEDLPDSVNVTVGAGGAGGTGSGGSGSDGGNSSFGDFVTANGGRGAIGTPSTGGTCAAGFGEPGEGGAASTNGDINLAGGDGSAPKSCVAENAVGGEGGASYWGEGGQGGNANLAEISDGKNGIAWGSGGGGGAIVDVADTANGGNGAGGVVVVYSYVYSGGADFAEWYETKEDVEAGDVVTLSDELLEYDSQLGPAKIPVLEKAKRGSNFIGVVSSAPSGTIGEDIFTKAKRPRPITLMGRVPVKVSTENGKIQPGDLLTLSSTPGVAMKATEPGRVIGVALESSEKCTQEELETGNCKILMFINPHWSLGSLTENGSLASSGINEISDQIGENSLEIGILDQFTLAIKKALEKLGLLIENGIAKVEKIFAKEIVVEGIKSEEIETTRIKIKDKATGEIYCLWIENGELKKEKGECDEELKTQISKLKTEEELKTQSFDVKTEEKEEELKTQISNGKTEEELTNEIQNGEPAIEQSNNENSQENE